jgi:hypothetical protein
MIFTRAQESSSGTAPNFRMEQLEDRTLLTTLAGFVDDTPWPRTFDYLDARDNIIRITVGPGVVAEFIGGRGGPFFGSPVVIGNMVQPFFDADGNLANEGQGRDLFHVYVAAADENGFISVAQLRTDPNQPILIPHMGSVDLRIFPNFAGEDDPSVDLGPGVAVLGGRTSPMEGVDSDDEDWAIYQAGLPGGFGVRPAGLDDFPEDPFFNLAAGLRVASGVNLGKFLFGGVVMGKVNIGGSMDTFYAGNVITGNARGGSLGFVQHPDNFRVFGDLRNLVVSGHIGNDGEFENDVDEIPWYTTGFDMSVLGRLGQVTTRGTLVGSVRVDGNPLLPTLPEAYTEVEATGITVFQQPIPINDPFPFMVETVGLRNFLNAHIGPGALASIWQSDTFDSPQYLGTFNSHTHGHNMVHVAGNLNLAVAAAQHDRVDYVDYYGVSLMAGQSIEVHLLGQGVLSVGVFDPDGRLIATDHSAVDPSTTFNQPFRVKAERPGTYRFAVAHFSDIGYVGATNTFIGTIEYELLIREAGTITAAAVVAGERYLDHMSGRPGIEVYRGDFGELYTGDMALSFGFGQAASIGVWGGNLRGIDADKIGWRIENTFAYGLGLDLMVPGGSVGFVRARNGTDGILSLNPNFAILPPTQVAIGGGYQTIHAEDHYYGVLNANGGLGVLRAGDMAQISAPSIINVNVDRRGRDGIIDLIDVAGDMGRLAVGGPQITTGPGGNVRYIRVGGTVYSDAFFGGGQPPVTTHSPGQQVFFRDDSGAQMILTPVGGIPNPDFNPDEPEDPEENPRFLGLSSLQTITYGIRGSGGVVLIEVVSNGGLNVRTHSAGAGTTAEIGRIELVHPGRQVILPPAPDDDNGNGNGTGGGNGFGSTQPPTPVHPDRNMQIPQVQRPIAGRPVIPLQLAQGENLEVTLSGTAPIDVLHIIAFDPENPGQLSHPTRIINQTPGEIVIVHANSIGELVSAGTIGLAKNHSGAVVSPIETVAIEGFVAGALFPFGDERMGIFDQQKIGIMVSGDIISVRANRGLGNVVAAGTIGEVVANADRRRIPGIFSGISGPIWSVIEPGLANPSSIQGRILFVDIGEGLAPGGTGNRREAGIFSDNLIGTIVNQGLGSNIWGPINAGSPAAVGRIDLVHLVNGAVIGGKIMSAVEHNMTRELPLLRVYRFGVSPIDDPVWDIGEIRITGPRSGMIGAEIGANQIGPTNVGGFGILNSRFSTAGSGRIATMTVGGYGLRNVFITGGMTLDGIVTLGRGQHLPATRFTPDVRRSEGGAVDPRFGFQINRLTDIHAVLGTSAAVPVIQNITDAGAIANVLAVGSRDLGLVHVHRVRGAEFQFANSINVFNVRNTTLGLVMTAGQLNHFRSVSEVLATNIVVSGPIRDVTMLANFGTDSTIEAIGPGGNIRNVTVGRNYDGTMMAVAAMENVRVGGQFNGLLEIQGAAVTPIKLHHFQVNGPYAGTFDVIGSVGRFIVGGPLLPPPEVPQVDPNLPGPERRLVIQGNINELRIGGNMVSDVRVLGSAGRIVVGGSILSDVELEVDDILGTLAVHGNIQEGAVIRARQLNELFVRGTNQGIFDIWSF